VETQQNPFGRAPAAGPPPRIGGSRSRTKFRSFTSEPKMRKILLLSVSVCALEQGAAAQTIDLGEVSASAAVGSAEDDAVATPKPGTAAAVALTQSSLYSIEPESILSENFIRNVASPASDYLSIAQFAPSSHDSNPNGAGFDSKNGTIRGFQDGQYNVTFDGIPFGDPSEFGHATTSFFPAPVLGSVVVDRGPGTASQLGNATFGGTIALHSETPTPDPSGRVTGAYGSGNVYEEGLEANAGSIAETGGTTGFFNYNHLQGDGLLQFAGQRQDNWFAKLQQPIGNSTVLTLVGDYDYMDFQNFVQEPNSQTNIHGLSFAGLNDDPDTEEFFLNNVVRRRSDFEYLGVASDFGVVRIDNKVYTYSLNDHTVAAVDQIDPLLKLIPDGIPGVHVSQFYRAYGDFGKIEGDVGEGWTSTTIRAGFWAEHTWYSQIEQTVDLADQELVSLLQAPGEPKGDKTATVFENYANSDTTQSFIEFEWKPLPGLTVTPGFKHIDFTRSFTGNSTALQAGAIVSNTASYSANLGSTEVNYRIRPDLSVYGQWAMGFQAPVADLIENKDAAASHVSPQQTINYQTGLVWKSDRLVADIDGYYINFRNAIGSQIENIGLGGTPITVFFDQGGVIYKGVEAEATYLLDDDVLGGGWGFTANGSINSAASKTTGLQIANAPTSTAGFGPVYDKDAFFGSLLTKYVGHRFAGAGELPTFNPNARLPSYDFTDLSAGYRLENRLTLQVLVSDLFDHHTVTDGSGARTSPTFYHLPGRSYLTELTLKF